MRYLFSQEAAAELQRIAMERTLCAFDFDGTLAPITERPEDAGMRPQTRALLKSLAEAFPCIVVSGRGRRDVLEKLAGVPVVGVFGNHGAESEGLGEADTRRVAEWRRELEAGLGELEGAWVEDKGLSLAVHYRMCADKTEARAKILAVARQLDDARVMGGKQVVNVVRAGAPHKGDVIQAERRRLGCTCMLFVGDDENDEDAFAADPRTMSVRVGRKQDSHARFFLKAQGEVDRLLGTLIGLRADATKVACP